MVISPLTSTTSKLASSLSPSLCLVSAIQSVTSCLFYLWQSTYIFAHSTQFLTYLKSSPLVWQFFLLCANIIVRLLKSHKTGPKVLNRCIPTITIGKRSFKTITIWTRIIFLPCKIIGPKSFPNWHRNIRGLICYWLAIIQSTRNILLLDFCQSKSIIQILRMWYPYGQSYLIFQ